MLTQFHYSTLPTGLRMVAIHRPGAPVGHCGVVVGAGSRDEDSDRYGLAHFVEHTIFKGTRRRRAWHILNRMETVGGELNAFTTKEETTLYTTYPAGCLARALDLLADLTCDSVFPEGELEKERQVVEDEIDTYLDIPSEGIFDDYDEAAFAGSQLAHPILGTRDSLARLGSAECRDFLDRFYTPGRMLLFYSGPTAPDRFFRMAERYFSPLTRPDTPYNRILPPEVATFDIERPIGSHQAHTVLGARIGGVKSPDRYAMALLTNILGGPGMNSLLNVALRERRGLVYTIDASTSLLSDSGLFTIYFGCDREDTAKCLRLCRGIVGDCAATALTPRRLEQAKTQYLGQLAVSLTNTEQSALAVARSTLLHGRATTMTETEERIRNVSAADLLDAAASLQLSRLTLC